MANIQGNLNYKMKWISSQYLSLPTPELTQRARAYWAGMNPQFVTHHGRLEDPPSYNHDRQGSIKKT